MFWNRACRSLTFTLNRKHMGIAFVDLPSTAPVAAGVGAAVADTLPEGEAQPQGIGKITAAPIPAPTAATPATSACMPGASAGGGSTGQLLHPAIGMRSSGLRLRLVTCDAGAHSSRVSLSGSGSAQLRVAKNLDSLLWKEEQLHSSKAQVVRMLRMQAIYVCGGFCPCLASLPAIDTTAYYPVLCRHQAFLLLLHFVPRTDGWTQGFLGSLPNPVLCFWTMPCAGH